MKANYTTFDSQISANASNSSSPTEERTPICSSDLHARLEEFRDFKFFHKLWLMDGMPTRQVGLSEAIACEEQLTTVGVNAKGTFEHTPKRPGISNITDRDEGEYLARYLKT